MFVNIVKYCTTCDILSRKYSRISPYFTMFLMFHNNVCFFVLHQFADKRAKKWTNPVVLPAACLAAMQRGNGHFYMESSFLILEPGPRRRGYINRRPCPRVRPRGHTTQRARGEIFKLSLPTGQSNSWNEKLKLKRMGGGEMRRMNMKVMGARFGCCWSETARRWLPARCGAAVASCPMWRGDGFLGRVGGRKCQARSDKSRTNVEKCS